MNSTNSSFSRRQPLRKCNKSNQYLDAQDSFIKKLTVKALIGIKEITNRIFVTGERRDTWVAMSYHTGKYLGFGVFVNGKVRKDDFLLIYRGDLKVFTPHSDDNQNAQPRLRMGSAFKSSKYVLEFTDDDGVRYVVNGERAEITHGSIGHFVNSVPVGTSEDLEPCRFEWSPKFNAFVIKANYPWDSGQEYVELRVNYCKNAEDLAFWSDNTTFQHLSNQEKQIVLENAKNPIEPVVTRQDYSKKRKVICQNAANCKKAKNELRKLKNKINMKNLKGYK